MSTHMMSNYELQAVFEEAHYHQTIDDIVDLMMKHGEDKITQAIHDKMLVIECIMSPPTEVYDYV